LQKKKHGDDSEIFSLLDQARIKLDRKFRDRVFRGASTDLKQAQVDLKQAQVKIQGGKRSSGLYRLKNLKSLSSSLSDLTPLPQLSTIPRSCSRSASPITPDAQDPPRPNELPSDLRDEIAKAYAKKRERFQLGLQRTDET